MTRRVFDNRSLDVRLNATQYLFMLDLGKRSGFRSRPIPMSLRECCEVCDRSSSAVSRAIRALVGQGMVTVCPQFSGNGAQVKNAYKLTPRGIKILHMAQLPQNRKRVERGLERKLG